MSHNSRILDQSRGERRMLLNTMLALGLLLWGMFALALGVTTYALSVPEDMTPDGRVFWCVFVTTSLLGWALSLLVIGLVKFAKRRPND